MSSLIFINYYFQIMETKSIITWEDIAGLDFSKKTLQEIVILPIMRP